MLAYLLEEAQSEINLLELLCSSIIYSSCPHVVFTVWACQSDFLREHTCIISLCPSWSLGFTCVVYNISPRAHQGRILYGSPTAQQLWIFGDWNVHCDFLVWVHYDALDWVCTLQWVQTLTYSWSSTSNWIGPGAQVEKYTRILQP